MRDQLNWDHFDDLIESYASAFVFEGRRQQLELEIARVCASITASRPTMDDFTYFLDTGLWGKSAVQRKIAWAAQHIFGLRAWCVGPRLFEKSQRRFFSPLLEQLRALSLDIRDVDVSNFRRRSHGAAKFWSQASIDAMLVDAVRQRVILIKGISWSQCKGLSKRLTASKPGAGLFEPLDRVFVNAYAAAQALRPLVHARNLIEQASDCQVEAHFVLMDDPGCSWRYQCHNVETVELHHLAKGAKHCLDDLPCSGTFLDKQAVLDADSDAFAQLPAWPSTEFLNLVPIDRPCRAMMQLQELFARQEQTPKVLQAVSASEIADAVEQRYRIFYPVNRQRHDIEACLRTGGFVRRVRDSENAYAITAKGYVRCLLMRQKFQPRTGVTPSRVIIEIQRQAELWYGARGRSTF